MGKRKSQVRALFIELIETDINKRNIAIFIIPIILSLIVCYVIKDLIYNSYLETRTSGFTLVSACIWIGIFNCIQSICSIRSRIKIQYIQGMSIGAFVLANVLYELLISLIQAVLVSLVFFSMVEYNDNFIFISTIFEYFLIIFLVIFSSSMLGLMLSSFSKNSTNAMTIIPFILVLQMILSNALFSLNEFLDKCSLLMISRWGIDGIGTICNVEKMVDYTKASFPEITYQYSQNHFLMICFILFGFTLIYIVITILRLKRIDRESLF